VRAPVRGRVAHRASSVKRKIPLYRAAALGTVVDVAHPEPRPGLHDQLRPPLGRPLADHRAGGDGGQRPGPHVGVRGGRARRRGRRAVEVGPPGPCQEDRREDERGNRASAHWILRSRGVEQDGPTSPGLFSDPYRDLLESAGGPRRSQRDRGLVLVGDPPPIPGHPACWGAPRPSSAAPRVVCLSSGVGLNWNPGLQGSCTAQPRSCKGNLGPAQWTNLNEPAARRGQGPARTGRRPAPRRSAGASRASRGWWPADVSPQRKRASCRGVASASWRSARRASTIVRSSAAPSVRSRSGPGAAGGVPRQRAQCPQSPGRSSPKYASSRRVRHESARA